MTRPSHIAALLLAFCLGGLCVAAFLMARGNCELACKMRQAEFRGFAHRDPLSGEYFWVEFRK